MANLTRAHQELFRREPDERFESLPALLTHCRHDRERSTDRWQPPDCSSRTRSETASCWPSATTGRSG